MTRSQTYAIVNGILYALSRKGECIGEPRMLADELDKFEEFCPHFGQLSDDWTLDFGPNRVGAILAWRAQTQ